MKTFTFFIGYIILGLQSLMAQMPQTLNYQGIIEDANGEALSDNTYQMTFHLYDQRSGGSSQWSEEQSVVVNDGVFNVVLGNTNPLTINFDRKYWMGTKIGIGGELDPRIELTGSAFSLEALSVAPGAVVQSINGIKDDVEIAAGENVSVTRDGKKLTISASGANGGGGDITGVRAGEGLMGGGNRGEVRLSIGKGAVSSDLIGANAVISTKIAGGSITSDHLSDGIITAKKIAEGQVVKSINGLEDAVEISEGENIQIKRRGNRLEISTIDGDHGDIKAIEPGRGLTGGGSSGTIKLGLQSPLVLVENSIDPIILAKNVAGPAIKASHSSQTEIYLGQKDNALYAKYKEGVNATICSEKEAVVGNGLYSKGALGTEKTGVYGGAFHGSMKAGIFDGRVDINGMTTLTNRGSGAVLLNFETDRSWQLRQFGTQGGTSLEFASVGGGANKNFLITTGGRVGIGTTDPRGKLHVGGSVLADEFRQTSSRRWKKNISTLENAMEKVMRLRGVSYQWKKNNQRQIGLIAEEVGQIVPEIVDYDENGIDARSVNYAALVSLLIEALKEQQTQIEELQNNLP